MKNIVLALLFVTIVLFVAVESHGRYGRRGSRWPSRVNNRRRGWGTWPFGSRRRLPWKGEAGRWHKPCNETEPPRNCSVFVDGTCLECDEGFALETKNFSRKPDQRPTRWYNRGLFGHIFHSRKSAGNGANFHGCNKTISFCVPCSRYLKIIDPEKCKHNGGCGPGCTDCSSPGVCIECKQDMKLYTPPDSSSVQCIPLICKPNMVKPTIEEGEPVVLEP